MARLSKNMYRSLKSGEKKINSYKINIPKEIIRQVNFKDGEELKITAKDNEIIITKHEKK